MNKKEVKKAPALRFKGFTNDWEQRKLGCLMNITSVKRIHQSDWRKKGIPFYRARDITALSKNLNIEEPIFISRDLYEEYSKISGKVQINDLLVTGVGTIGVPLLVQTVPLYFKDGNIIWFQNSNKLIGLFFLYLFKTNTVQKYIHTTTGVGTVPTYTIQSGKNTPVYITSKKEQKDIGTIFQLIDNLISLQQRKLRLLKLLKKATQQNIFASTECLPKLKYRNLTEKWQLYRLKDVAKITMGQSPNSKNYTQNPIDHILVQGNADIRNGYVFPRIWTTEITKIASKGDIILCVRAPAGDVGRTKFNVVIGRGVAAIKGNDFIFQQLQFMKSSGYWKKYISGSTFESINSNDIKNAKIFCPSQLEQKNISSLLDDIDTSIQIQQKNILDFKYIKQFLLQNMFI